MAILVRLSRTVFLLAVLLTWPVLARAQAACQADYFVGLAVWPTQSRGDWVVLSTEARVQSRFGIKPEPQWRFRSIPAGKRGLRIDKVALSSDATHALIAYEGQVEIAVDLSNALLQIPENAEEARKLSRRKPIGSAPRECALESDSERDRKQLAQLDEHMTRAAHPVRSKPVEFRYFEARPDSQLYAPVLQFYAGERVRPSAFAVWADLVPPEVAAGTSSITKAQQAAMFREYQILRPPCVIHYRDRPREPSPGAWVIQYWFYYPFDVGGVGPHLHDSEHLFVEVDKLGGAVRRVAGAGHGLWAPNNIYHTYQTSALPIELPLFVVVEHGKHATAPDIDRDGWFTPGVDSNNYYDAAKVWGVRDTIGVTDSNMKPYAATMMVKRDRAFAFWNKTLADRFEEAAREGMDPANTCTLVELPEVLPGSRCDEPTAACASSQVGSHDDYKDPEKILKPALYPPLALRLAYTRMPTARSQSATEIDRSHRVILGAAFELARFLGGIPGRAAVEAVIDTKSKDTHFNGVVGRYEWLTSNLFGLYTGASWITDDLGDRSLDPINRAFWASAGGLVEVPVGGILGPLLKKANLDRRLTAQASGGLMYNNYYRLNWDLRVGFAVTFLSPNRDFGIKANVPSPW